MDVSLPLTQTELTPTLHEQHGKEKVMVRYGTQYHRERTIFWSSSLVDSKDGVDFAKDNKCKVEIYTIPLSSKINALKVTNPLCTNQYSNSFLGVLE